MLISPEAEDVHNLKLGDNPWFQMNQVCVCDDHCDICFGLPRGPQGVGYV